MLFFWLAPSLLLFKTVPLFLLLSFLLFPTLHFATHSGRSWKTGMINSQAFPVLSRPPSLPLPWSMAVSAQSEGVKGNRAALMNWTRARLLLSRQRSSSDLHTGTGRGGHKDRHSSVDLVAFTAVNGTVFSNTDRITVTHLTTEVMAQQFAAAYDGKFDILFHMKISVTL